MAFPQALMAEAVGDWQFEVSELLLGADTPYMVTGIAGLKDRQPRATYPNRPLGHGSLPLPDYLQSKQVVMNLSLPNPDDPLIHVAGRLDTLIDQLQLAWAPMLDGQTLKTLRYQLPGGPKKRLYGRPRNIAIDMANYDLGWVDAVVEFVATDPVSYADELSSAAIAMGDPSVGRAYNRVYPMAYGAATSGSLAVSNDGTSITYPVITFVGPVTNPSAENLTTGQRVRFGIALVLGDTLVVDAAARTVILNGTASRYNTMTSAANQWWGLIPGINSVKYAADAFVLGSAMTVEWRSAWF